LENDANAQFTNPTPSGNNYSTPIHVAQSKNDNLDQNNTPPIIRPQSNHTDDVSVRVPTIPTIESAPSSKSVLMADEGASFPLVCEVMGWCHILDRKHFTDQITSTWQNAHDPKEYRNSIVSILNAPTVKKYNILMQKCKQQFSTPKAIAY